MEEVCEFFTKPQLRYLEKKYREAFPDDKVPELVTVRQFASDEPLYFVVRRNYVDFHIIHTPQRPLVTRVVKMQPSYTLEEALAITEVIIAPLNNPAVRIIQPLCLVTGSYRVSYKAAMALNPTFLATLLKHATELEVYTKILQIMMNMEKEKQTAEIAFGVFQEVSIAKIELLKDPPGDGKCHYCDAGDPVVRFPGCDHPMGHKECLEANILEWYNCFECDKTLY